jgi:23S rRNA (pseudouridine1915-N3)-methyltransferase
MPRWVREAVDDYLTRLTTFKTAFLEIDPGHRSGGGDIQRAMDSEAKKLLATLRKDEFVVTLDERGTELTTRELASWLGARMQDGRDLAFLIGGPDGFAPDVLARADFKWSLSRLTFPHALVRVLLAEQLYRAQSVLANHPYHRE